MTQTRLKENQLASEMITEEELAAALAPINQGLADQAQDISDINTQLAALIAEDITTDAAIVDLQSQINSSGVTANFTRTDTLAISTGQARWYAPKNIVLNKYEAWVGVAPAGASIVISVLKNGAPALTITIPAGVYYVSDTISIAMAPTDYLTVNITQVGSSTPGDELNLRLTGN